MTENLSDNNNKSYESGFKKIENRLEDNIDKITFDIRESILEKIKELESSKIHCINGFTKSSGRKEEKLKNNLETKKLEIQNKFNEFKKLEDEKLDIFKKKADEDLRIKQENLLLEYNNLLEQININHKEKIKRKEDQICKNVKDIENEYDICIKTTRKSLNTIIKTIEQKYRQYLIEIYGNNEGIKHNREDDIENTRSNKKFRIVVHDDDDDDDNSSSSSSSSSFSDNDDSSYSSTSEEYVIQSERKIDNDGYVIVVSRKGYKQCLLHYCTHNPANCTENCFVLKYMGTKFTRENILEFEEIKKKYGKDACKKIQNCMKNTQSWKDTVSSLLA